MLRTFWSVKGGSGVSVTSAVVAGILAGQGSDTVLVDLCGDLPALLAMAEPRDPGLFDWCATPDRRTEALERLLQPVRDGLRLLPRGSADLASPSDLRSVVATIAALGPDVVVDAGLRPPDGATDGWHSELARSGRSYLVIRPCYLALRRAVRQRVEADGVVLLVEPGRALDRHDVADVLGLPVSAVVEVDPAVARSVDAGTIVRRHHRPFRRAVRALT